MPILTVKEAYVVKEFSVKKQKDYFNLVCVFVDGDREYTFKQFLNEEQVFILQSLSK